MTASPPVEDLRLPAERPGLPISRTTAAVTGVFFLTAAVSAVVGLALYGPVLDDPAYVLGAGADTRIRVGAFCEVVLAISCIGTGVALHPVVRARNEGAALAYVCGRVVEATIIVVGIVSLLAVVSLRQDAGAGSGAAGDATLAPVAAALVALHDATFLMGPGLAIGVNTLLLAALVHRAGLTHRAISGLGLVGGPLVFASSTAVLFGAYAQTSPWAAAAALPVATWELSFAVHLLVQARRLRPATA